VVVSARSFKLPLTQDTSLARKHLTAVSKIYIIMFKKSRSLKKVMERNGTIAVKVLVTVTGQRASL
jgi:hypothetical protein